MGKEGVWEAAPPPVGSGVPWWTPSGPQKTLKYSPVNLSKSCSPEPTRTPRPLSNFPPHTLTSPESAHPSDPCARSHLPRPLSTSRLRRARTQISTHTPDPHVHSRARRARSPLRPLCNPRQRTPSSPGPRLAPAGLEPRRAARAPRGDWQRRQPTPRARARARAGSPEGSREAPRLRPVPRAGPVRARGPGCGRLPSRPGNNDNDGEGVDGGAAAGKRI